MGRLSSARLKMTRGRKMTIGIAILGLIAIPASFVLASDTFSDVPTSAFYHDQVNALVNAQITAGCGGTHYCPNSAVTRGQMAVFLDRIGNLSNEHGPVVDALTLDGGIVVGFEESFDLVGGAPFECATTTSGFPFGSYWVQHQLFDILPPVAGVGITTRTDEVLVSLKDVDDVNNEYDVCFRRIAGGVNLEAGVYDTYGTFSFDVGQGIFASGARAASIQDAVAKFRAAKAR
jgi:hypothetical protein